MVYSLSLSYVVSVVDAVLAQVPRPLQRLRARPRRPNGPERGLHWPLLPDHRGPDAALPDAGTPRGDPGPLSFVGRRWLTRLRSGREGL